MNERIKNLCLATIILVGLSISCNIQLSADGLRQSPHSINQPIIVNKSFINQKEDRGTLAFNQSINTKMSTTELGPQGPFPSISQRIINDLGNATSDEIATYPINDLSPEVLVKVLNGLSADNLFKVLVNLPHDDLKTLFGSKLVPEQSKEILNRIPQDKRTEIQNRVN